MQTNTDDVGGLISTASTLLGNEYLFQSTKSRSMKIMDDFC